MARSSWLAVGLGLVLASAGARAGETYAIKIKEAVKGDAVQVEATDKTDSQTRLVDAAGKPLLDPKGKPVLDKAQKVEKASAYRETVLEKEPGKPRATRLERHYDKAQLTTDGKTVDLPYQGKTVLIEKKDDKYHFRIKDGEELKGDDAQPLNEEFNRGGDEDFDLQKAILPGKPVAVDDVWKLDVAALAAAFARSSKMQLDADKAEGTGKLVKVYDKDGARFGVMQLHLEIPIKEIGEGKGKLTLKAGSKWTMDITLDGCIDGSRLDGTRKSLSKIDARGAVSLQDGPEINQTVTASGDSQETSKEVKK
jgi:hypothetical protein